MDVVLKCSFIQIYNERIYDLLSSNDIFNPLRIREDKISGIFVEGLTEYSVQSEWDCLNLLYLGEKNTFVRSTQMNQHSSRSHTILQITMQTVQPDENGMILRSKLNLCDLAGSEKMNTEEDTHKEHVNELKKINLSLTILGKVISFLAQNNKTQYSHIPFRESQLTRLLQDSFGGGTKTLLVATLNPSYKHTAETISTLKFADRAKNVMQRVRRNELISAESDQVVTKMQTEIAFLKEMLTIKQNDGLSKQIKDLQSENERLKRLVTTNSSSSSAIEAKVTPE